MTGEVVGIFITDKKSAVMTELSQAELEKDRGLKGDRYYLEKGLFKKTDRVSRDITLIEIEAVEALARDYRIEVHPKNLRRNILTRGIALNHFVGKKLVIGDVVIEGHELCEPCGYLSKMLDLPLKEALKHRGGLRGRIVSSGEIFRGQKITCHATQSELVKSTKVEIN